MKAIEVSALTKYYGKSRGIVGLDLSVDEGDFFGFIGPNGAGKSTTIRILLGLISPTSGGAKVLGRDVTRDRREILRDVGYMPSEAFFYPNMKVREVIRLSADLRHMDCREEAGVLCRALELDMEKRIGELSLGNRKKVSIVCALQHKPRLCILDEPTSGLDPLMQRAFYQILEERNQAGTTVFLSSHVLSEVQRYCRHAAVIREGRLLVTDSTHNLGHTDAKRVTLQGVEAPPELVNIRDVKIGSDTVSFLYDGEPGVLLRCLGSMKLTNVTITEPDLEEIFLHYYETEGN